VNVDTNATSIVRAECALLDTLIHCVFRGTINGEKWSGRQTFLYCSRGQHRRERMYDVAGRCKIVCFQDARYVITVG